MNDDEPRIRVLAADDQRVVREGIAMILSLLPDVEVVGTAADGEEALALAGKWRPDVVLMDLRMPRLDGVEATRRLRAEFPDIRVIALTTYADDRSVVSALRAGAVGYLTKDAGAEEIRQALLRVTSGQPVIDPAVQRPRQRPCRLPRRPRPGRPRAPRTSRSCRTASPPARSKSSA
jgi:DNA-binding NarL/FixJ family response regulator